MLRGRDPSQAWRHDNTDGASICASVNSRRCDQRFEAPDELFEEPDQSENAHGVAFIGGSGPRPG